MAKQRTWDEKKELLSQIEADRESGATVDAALEAAGITQATYYTWRSKLKAKQGAEVKIYEATESAAKPVRRRQSQQAAQPKTVAAFVGTPAQVAELLRAYGTGSN